MSVNQFAGKTLMQRACPARGWNVKAQNFLQPHKQVVADVGGVTASAPHASLRALRRVRSTMYQRQQTQTRIHASSDSGRGVENADAASDASFTFGKLLVCVMDPNPYLGTGTRQLLATAAGLASGFKGSTLSIMCLDDKTWEFDNDTRLKTIRWHLQENGCEVYDLAVSGMSPEETPLAMTVADLVDELDATLLLLTTDSVEDGYIDANLLAKFVGCSFLFVE